MPSPVELDSPARTVLVARLQRVPEARALVDSLFTPSSPSLTALDRRRLGVTPESYEELIEPLGEALRKLFPDPVSDLIAYLDAKEWVAERLTEMAATARAADLNGIPPATGAQVIGMDRFGGATGDEVLVVHLEAPYPLEYAPGQAFPVLHPGTGVVRGDPVWAELAPALPPNEFGQVQFFLPGAMREPNVGEYWTIGNARGSSVDVGDVWTSYIDATGEKLAGARAAVFGSVDKRAAGGTGANVVLTVDALGETEPGLAALARTAGWLTMQRG